jgi:PAS domain S-box-containing protein
MSENHPPAGSPGPPPGPVTTYNPETMTDENLFIKGEEAYQQILDAIDDMVLVKGEHSRIVWANRAFRDYYGMTVAQLRQIIDAPFNEAENTQQYVIDDRHVYVTGQTLNVLAEKVTRHDGLVQFFNTVKSPLRDAAGRVRLTVGVSRNITAQKQIEEELARHREHLENLVEERTRELHGLLERQQVIIRSLVEGIIAVDAAGRVTLMNPEAETFTGWPQSAAMGRALHEVLSLEDEKSRQPLPDTAALPAPGDAAGAGRRLFAWVKAREGEARLVSVNAARLVGAAGTAGGCVLVLRDISEDRKIEDQNLRHQKLESLGLLAGGIAHDFNNLLMAVLGNLSLVRLELPAGSPLAAALGNAEGACHRARSLSTQLLTFARGGAPVKKVLPLETPVREAAELALRGSPVALEMRVAARLDLVEADEGQLSQVVNNLALNAKQAMPLGGRVTISLENVELTEADRLPLAPGRYVRITVQDDGPGIPPGHLSRIFDPYFTTKDTGSGLGLASVHSIVTRHGGHVAVSSQPGLGACFTLLLPASSQTLVEAPVAARPQQAVRPLAVLVLDDDPAVRQVFKRMLAHGGHQATVVGTSKEALAAFTGARSGPRPFDVVFTDLTMPGDLPGEEVIRRLRATAPATRIVIMSGYSTSSLLANHQELGLTGALAKPFDIEAVRTVLASVQTAIEAEAAAGSK